MASFIEIRSLRKDKKTDNAGQKKAHAGHVLRGSGGISAVLKLEGKIRCQNTRPRPGRNWIDDTKEWTNVKDYSELKRTSRGELGTST